MRQRALAAAVVLALCASSAPARVLKKFELGSGRTDKNRISEPLYEAGALEPVAIEAFVSRLAPDHVVSRTLPGGVGIADFTLDPGLDLGRQLALALQEEGAAMGLRTAAAGAAGWTVSGTLDDLLLQTRTGAYRPILFYSYMKVTLTVRRGEEAPSTAIYRLSNMYARFDGSGLGAGYGVQDEVSEALANFLIDSAQEIVARLNREVFKAPALPGAMARAEALLAAGDLDDREADLRRIGLSGAPAAAPILLRLLARERDDGNRTYVIDALANLGAAEAVQPLAERYAREDEDNRLFTLKAWDYIGGEEARSLIAQHGGKDKDAACRALAVRLRGKTR